MSEASGSDVEKTAPPSTAAVGQGLDAFVVRRSFLRGIVKLALVIGIVAGVVAAGSWLIQSQFTVGVGYEGGDRRPVDDDFFKPPAL